MLRWAFDRGVRLHHIARVKPIKNAFIERFNGRLRDECVNEYDFTTLADLWQILSNWRDRCTTARPHEALGWTTPEDSPAAWRLINLQNSPLILGGMMGIPSGEPGNHALGLRSANIVRVCARTSSPAGSFTC
jgi:Integrase core domain